MIGGSAAGAGSTNHIQAGQQAADSPPCCRTLREDELALVILLWDRRQGKRFNLSYKTRRTAVSSASTLICTRQ